MKAILTLFAGLMAISSQRVAAECDKLPDVLDIDIWACCRIPLPISTETETKIFEQFKDDKSDPTVACKVSEAFLKELKLVKGNEIDKDAFIKYIDAEVKEAYWKPVIKTSFEKCHKDIMAKKDGIMKALEKAPFDIKKNQCQPIFMALFACLYVEGFGSCPKEAWKESKKCSDAKTWIGKCGSPVDAMEAISKQIAFT